MEDTILRLIIQVPGFLFAIVFHEFAHAYMAFRFGDSTAKDLGRMSLNPVPHIDLFGTIILPAVSVLLGGVMFGWAKPVPADTRRMKNIRKGIFWISCQMPGIICC